MRTRCSTHVHVRVQRLERDPRRCRLRLTDPVGRVQHLPLQVRGVDGVRVDEPDRADAGSGEVERRGRAEAAGAEQQHLGVEQAQLARLADLGDQDVARVPLAALGVEQARHAPLVTAGLPAREAAGQRLDVAVAERAERLGRERRARARLAADDDGRVAVGDETPRCATRCARAGCGSSRGWRPARTRRARGRRSREGARSPAGVRRAHGHRARGSRTWPGRAARSSSARSSAGFNGP